MNEHLKVTRTVGTDKLYLVNTKTNVSVRFYAEISALEADKDWRNKIIYCNGDFGQYARLGKQSIEMLDL